MTLALSPRRRRAVTGGVMTAMFMAALEATVVSTAMPTVIGALGGLAHYSWVFSAYLITATVTVPVWGKLSDLYGRRPLYQAGIALFLLGSILSGMSRTMGQLIVFRAIQGLGAGAIVPVSMTIIADIYTLEERTRMQALFSSIWGISSILGPVAGGFITDQLSWRWVFFINIPFGIAAAAIIGAAMREPEREKRPVIDYSGAALLMVSVTLLMFGLIEGGGGMSRLLAPASLALFGGAALLFALFLQVERRAVDPIIPLSIFSNRVVSVSVVAGFLAGVGMFGAITFIPLFAQGGLGVTATEAGSLLTPLLLSWVGLSVVGGKLLLRVGYRRTSIAGFTLLTVGFVLLATFPASAPRAVLYLDLAVVGAGLGLSMLTLLIAVQQAVPRSDLGTATSLNQFARSIGGAIGVAGMGVMLSSALAAHLGQAAQQGLIAADIAARLAHDPSALIEPQAGAALSGTALQVLRASLTSAIHSVFWVAAAATVLALGVAFLLPGPARATPKREACTAEAGERMIMAELATIDPPNEPVESVGDRS
ncbi:MAG TPA: MDR family MFS transporter [Candidatus Eisenbacteria bacterium]